VQATDVAEAILSVLPVDTAVEPAVFRIEAAGGPEALMPVHEEFQAIANAAEGRDVAVAHLERYEFYRRTEEAYVVVATGEDRLYGCFLITKGVVV
jgi:L-fucose mutarotase